MQKEGSKKVYGRSFFPQRICKRFTALWTHDLYTNDNNDLNRHLRRSVNNTTQKLESQMYLQQMDKSATLVLVKQKNQTTAEQTKPTYKNT